MFNYYEKYYFFLLVLFLNNNNLKFNIIDIYWYLYHLYKIDSSTIYIYIYIVLIVMVNILIKDSAKMAAPIGFDAMSRRLAFKLSRLNIRREEYVFMKAMLLLNPGY